MNNLHNTKYDIKKLFSNNTRVDTVWILCVLCVVEFFIAYFRASIVTVMDIGFVLVGIVFAIYMLTCKKVLHWSISSFIALIMMVSYIAPHIIKAPMDVNNIRWCTISVLCLVLMNVFAEYSFDEASALFSTSDMSDYKEKVFRYWMWIWTIGHFVRLVYTIVVDYFTDKSLLEDMGAGWYDPIHKYTDDRNVYYFLVVCTVSMLIPTVMEIKKNIMAAIVITIMLLLSIGIFVSSDEVGRGPILMIAGSVIMCIAIFVLYYWKERDSHRLLLKIIVAIMAIGVLAILIFKFSFKAGYMQNSSLAVSLYNHFFDGALFKNVRWRWMGIVISNLPKYPFGGGDYVFPYNDGTSRVSSSCHNFYGELAQSSGIIPLVFFVIYTIVSFINILVMALKRKASLFVCMVTLSIWVSCMVYYNIEHFSPSFLALWFFVNEYVSRFNGKYKDKFYI